MKSNKKNKKNKNKIISNSLKYNDTYIFEPTQTTYFGINKHNKFHSDLLCLESLFELEDYSEIIVDKTYKQVFDILEKQRIKEYPDEIIYIQRTNKNLQRFLYVQSFLYNNCLVDYYCLRKEVSSWILQYGCNFCMGYSNLDLKMSLNKIYNFLEEIILNINNEDEFKIQNEEQDEFKEYNEFEEQNKIIDLYQDSQNYYCSFTIEEMKRELKDIINLNYCEINNLDTKSIIDIINNKTIPNKIFLRTKENTDKFIILQDYIDTIKLSGIKKYGFDVNQNNVKVHFGWIMQINNEHYLVGLPNKTLDSVKIFVKNFIDRLRTYNLF